MAGFGKYILVTVTGRFVRIAPGVKVRLSKSQAKARAYGIEDKKNGVYLTTKMIEFKTGEQFKVEEGGIDKIARGNAKIGEPEKETAGRGKTENPDTSDSSDDDDMIDDLEPTVD